MSTPITKNIFRKGKKKFDIQVAEWLFTVCENLNSFNIQYDSLQNFKRILNKKKNIVQYRYIRGLIKKTQNEASPFMLKKSVRLKQFQFPITT
jgi:hypothetical protein